jgi:hypothetical protein
VSVDRLEARLAALLSTTGQPVGTGVAEPGATTSAAVSVAGVTPREHFATRLPAELLHRSLQRASAVTVRAVLTVAPGSAGGAREAALDAATVLWWRCEETPVAAGDGFPADDLTEGYRVLGVRPVSWTTPEAPDAAPDSAPPAAHHRIDLDVDALVWPRTAEPQAGPEIGPVLVRLTGSLAGASPVLVAAGRTAEIAVDVDLRSAVIGGTAPGDPAALPREVAVTVVPVGGPEPAGSVAGSTLPVAGGRVAVSYTAGDVPGRDELRFAVVPAVGDPLPIGAVPVEVTAS